MQEMMKKEEKLDIDDPLLEFKPIPEVEEEFKKQLPDNAKVLIEDEVEDHRGTRFTLVGKICNE